MADAPASDPPEAPPPPNSTASTVAQGADQAVTAGPAVLLNPLQPGLGLQLGIAAQLQVWQGQFPPPEAIERYEQVMPGAFDRIVSMAERQQATVSESAAETRRAMRDDTRRGHWLGFSITMGAVLGSVACAYLHQPLVATALVAVPVLSVARALIGGVPALASPPQVVTPPPTAAPSGPKD